MKCNRDGFTFSTNGIDLQDKREASKRISTVCGRGKTRAMVGMEAVVKELDLARAAGAGRRDGR